MSSTPIVLKGVVKEDGTLELSEKVNLPPGPVQVTVQAAPVDDFLARMEKIRADLQASGYVPRSKEEIDAELREMRDEWEEHQLELEALQEECRRQREQQERPPQ
jgi:hypothetical protein